MLIEILVWILVIIGLLFCALGVLGIYTMPDVYSKQHAAGLIDSCGVIFIFAGLILKSGLELVSIKTFLTAIILMLMGSPVTYAFMQFLIRREKPQVTKEYTSVVVMPQDMQGGGQSLVSKNSVSEEVASKEAVSEEVVSKNAVSKEVASKMVIQDGEKKKHD